MTRTYQKKKRLEREAETRQRIVEATVALHTSLGPAQTSISAVAERAGVQRHTVYAHFPDETALFNACSNHWFAQHPFPDSAPWAAVADPRKRLAAALTDVYRWYESVGDDLELFNRDATLSLGVAARVAIRLQKTAELASWLAAPLGRSRTRRAAVGHALAFETWRSLVKHEGLSTARAVRTMLTLVENA